MNIRLAIVPRDEPYSYTKVTKVFLELRRNPNRLVAITRLTRFETESRHEWEQGCNARQHPLEGCIWRNRNRAKLEALAAKLVAQYSKPECPVTFRVEA